MGNWESIMDSDEHSPNLRAGPKKKIRFGKSNSILPGQCDRTFRKIKESTEPTHRQDHRCNSYKL